MADFAALDAELREFVSPHPNLIQQLEAMLGEIVIPWQRELLRQLARILLPI
ncbi:hypothetical protein I3U64_00430 [Mycobacteroides abscessus subsp. abscessus]|uniref:hypothetical protein n=1 Tax=Mycobacteroides abscessus TaxID=36809 RepID=UPI0009C6F511|nr:hypothetical protein [Mycobacteroides abscessus]MBN7458612.1 hypothetical protein [Mycobacteroides abscessus subsp. abscessus]QSM02355.1 hypothetical protein PROPHIGD86-1_81 [Mycobacterium phage prophi86-1]SLJ45339.1 Uncharacterised protein [Mycobacteroides abscessus subsp. abscessus]